MMRVKTKVRISTIDGLGLFADQFIAKGTATWKYDPEFDTAFTQKQIDGLSETSQNYLRYYTYYDEDIKKYVLCCDNQRFINHSLRRSNIDSTPNCDIAARDIQSGEEMLCDYTKFDKAYFERMGLKQSDLKD